MFDKKQRIFFAVLVTIITLAGLKLFYSSAGNKSTTQNQTFEAPESDEDAVGFDPKTNTLRIGINGRLNSKDPLNSNSNLEKFFIYHVRQGLSKFNIRGAAELSDGVTASYVNPNTIQFTLGGKHAWITGSKITAADYVYSWKRALLIKGFKSGPLLLIKNARQFIESKGKAKLGIRAAKNNVFEVEFSAADKTILSQLTHPYTFPIKSPKQQNNSLKKRLLLTNGPYFHAIGGTSTDTVLQIQIRQAHSVGKIKQIRLTSIDQSNSLERFKGNKIGMVVGLNNTDARNALKQKIKFRAMGTGKILGVKINTNSIFANAEGRNWATENIGSRELRKSISKANFDFNARPLKNWLPQKIQYLARSNGSTQIVKKDLSNIDSVTIIYQAGTLEKNIIETFKIRMSGQNIPVKSIEISADKFEYALQNDKYDFALSSFEYHSSQPTAFFEELISQNDDRDKSWHLRAKALLSALTSVDATTSRTQVSKNIINIIQSNSLYIPLVEWQSLLLMPPQVAGVGLYGFLPIPILSHAKVLNL
jgi:ABC-type oligopeptide transport system substrate-binding subunit